MNRSNKLSFLMMSFIHETLYGLFRDPCKALLAAGLEAGQTVLEVGCGPGFFTIPASNLVGGTGSITALDVNPHAVEHVRQKIEREGVTNARVIPANAEQTDLPGRRYDLIFLFGLPRMIGDPEKIWNEMHRLLKDGGTLSVEGRLQPPGTLFRPTARRGLISRFIKIGEKGKND